MPPDTVVCHPCDICVIASRDAPNRRTQGRCVRSRRPRYSRSTCTAAQTASRSPRTWSNADSANRAAASVTRACQRGGAHRFSFGGPNYHKTFRLDETTGSRSTCRPNCLLYQLESNDERGNTYGQL